MKRLRAVTLLTSAVMILGFAASTPVFGQGAAQGLKDAYADHFLIGTAWQWRNGGLNNADMRATILREFNSLTHEDDLKPYNTMLQSGSTNTNIRVTLNAGARSVLQFAVDNNIPVRGHTLMWHAQMPNWFFQADMSNNTNSTANLASQAVMFQRMNSYIGNILTFIRDEYPTLNLYAYDVVNEIFLDNGNARSPGFGNSNDGGLSPWVSIFGTSHAWVDSAFTYARRHSATTFPNMKLFYNDYNEYHPDGKRAAIVVLATRLGPNGLGVLDGIGMQSHLSTSWPPVGSTYTQALTAFAAVPGIEIHITELDVTIESGATQVRQAEIYRDVFRALINAKAGGANITSVTLWGVTDDRSWRDDRHPLLFNAQFERKPAYDSVFVASGHIPPPPPPPPEVEPDSNGYYFTNTFEDGTTQFWVSRGDPVTIVNTTDHAYEGTRSLFVSGRTSDWHGVAYNLDIRAFVPGISYSFGVMAMYASGNATDTFKLTLQYRDAAGDNNWATIATAPAARGQWVQLLNTDFTIPAGATELLIYVEMPTMADFYIDAAFGAIVGKTTSVAPRNVLKSRAQPSISVKGRTLNINAESGSDVRIKIVNLNGRTVTRFSSKGSASFSLSKIPAGSYVVETVKNGRKTTNAITLR